jgi:hypothetical protein
LAKIVVDACTGYLSATDHYININPEMYRFQVFKVCLTLSFSHYHSLNVPYAHLLPKYRPQLDISLPPKDDPKILAFCVLSKNLTQLDFQEFHIIHWR